MKNKDKFAKEIVEIACGGDTIAVIKGGERVVRCSGTACSECLFIRCNCANEMKEWAEQEYIEKQVISKRDRAFLEYIKEEFKCIARDKNNNLFMYTSMLDMYKKGTGWWGSDYYCLNSKFDVDFPMVKWEDSKPWLIEDLKKLEVVEEYN